MGADGIDVEEGLARAGPVTLHKAGIEQPQPGRGAGTETPDRLIDGNAFTLKDRPAGLDQESAIALGQHGKVRESDLDRVRLQSRASLEVCGVTLT